MSETNLELLSKMDEFNFGALFRSILMQSKLIIIIAFVITSLSVFQYIFSDKVYRVSSLIQISQSDNLLSSQAMSNIFSSQQSLSLDNMAVLYDSRSNIKKLINKLNLNIIPLNLNKTDFIQISAFSLNDSSISSISIDFFEDGYQVYIDNKSFDFINYGEKFSNEFFEIEIAGANVIKNNRIDFQVIDIEEQELIEFYQEAIQVNKVGVTRSYFSTQNGILKISLNAKNKELGKKIIDETNNIFISNKIESESGKARKAVKFIDDQLKVINKLVDENKIELQNFQSNNKSINVDYEIQSIIDNISQLESQIGDLDVQLAESQIKYTSDNPIYINLLEQKRELELQKKNIETRIGKLPLAQQEYIDLFRNLELSQNLYTELMNRKLNFSIQEASTIGNISVIDNAYIDYIVSPRFVDIFNAFVFSIFIAILTAVIRFFFFIKITNPAELQDNGIHTPIHGVLPFIDENENDPDNNNNAKIQNFCQSLIINIENKLNEQDKGKVILFTSPTPANGKSFISQRFASSIANVNKKVLLIDADLRRGVIHKRMGLKSLSYDDFRNINNDNIDRYKINENFYVIPKVSSLKDQFRFIYEGNFKKLLNELSKNFDYIVIDTPPILNVSDTSLLMDLSDINYLVARHNVTSIREIKQVYTTTNQTGNQFDGLIYNGFERAKSYYGMYGIYGNYTYAYYVNKYIYEDYEYKN